MSVAFTRRGTVKGRSVPFCPYRQTHSGREDRAQTAIFLVLEHLIASRRLFQRKAMRRHKGRIELALRHVIEQAMHIALAVLLGGADGQALLIISPSGNLSITP